MLCHVKNIFFLLLFLLLVYATSAFAADLPTAAWQAKVSAVAVVNGDRVTLGDIAQPYGTTSASDWDKIKGTLLWRAPKEPSRPLTIARPKLYDALRFYLKGAAAQCILPENLTIQRGGSVHTREDLKAFLIREVQKKINSTDEATMEMRELNVPQYIFLDDVNSKLEASFAENIGAGRNSLQIQVIDPYGKIVRRNAASFFLDVWKTVPVVSKPLNRGAVLSPENITFEKKNLAYVKNPWDGKSGPWRITKILGTGSVITTDSIEILPLVSKSDKVVIVYQTKNLRVEAPAEALEDGEMGKMISVRNMQTGKKIFAKVHSSGMVFAN